jgi:hypothetical protein
VNVLALPVTYARKSETKRVQVFDGRERISVEEYAARHFTRDGWESCVLESRPFHGKPLTGRVMAGGLAW